MTGLLSANALAMKGEEKPRLFYTGRRVESLKIRENVTHFYSSLYELYTKCESFNLI
jgi:hypothetical protein